MPLQLSRPSRLRRVQIRTKAALADHLQSALAVELSTVPPYLCALYSLVDNTSEAFQVLKSVAVEEMLHMMLVCNLRNAIGDAEIGLSPDVVAVAAKYPTFIPHHATGGPFVQLQPASVALLETVFMAIEQPAPSGARPEANEFETIGQFYAAISQGFKALDADPGVDLFTGDPSRQQTSTYFGGAGGRLIPVTDLKSALAAIRQIVAQGEGASRSDTPYPGDQPFGTYNTYGLRDDGTIGPIVGGSWEMSHFSKFSRLASGDPPLGAVWPMRPNPDTASLTGDLAELSQLFDDVDGLLLRGLQASISSTDGEGVFFGAVLPLMHTALPLLAGALMQTPIFDGADPSLGPNAGPAFGVGTATAQSTHDRCVALAAAAAASSDTTRRSVWAPALQAAAPVLAALATQTGQGE